MRVTQGEHEGNTREHAPAAHLPASASAKAKAYTSEKKCVDIFASLVYNGITVELNVSSQSVGGQR